MTAVMESRIAKRFLATGFILLVVILWELAVRLLEVEEFLLPSPSVIATEFWLHLGSLTMDILYTAAEALVGFVIAIVFSLSVAVLFAHSRVLNDGIMPFLIGLKAVPIIAMAPLLVIWLGNGFVSKATMAAIICFFPIVVNTTKGLLAIPDEHLQLMQSLSASRRQVLLKIRLPNSMPFFFAALKIASTLAVVGAIVAEFSGANKGIGYVILLAALRIDTPMLFCGILMASLLGIVLYYAIEIAEKRLIRWEGGDVE